MRRLRCSRPGSLASYPAISNPASVGAASNRRSGLEALQSGGSAPEPTVGRQVAPGCPGLVSVGVMPRISRAIFSATAMSTPGRDTEAGSAAAGRSSSHTGPLRLRDPTPARAARPPCPDPCSLGSACRTAPRAVRQLRAARSDAPAAPEHHLGEAFAAAGAAVHDAAEPQTCGHQPYSIARNGKPSTVAVPQPAGAVGAPGRSAGITAWAAGRRSPGVAARAGRRPRSPGPRGRDPASRPVRVFASVLLAAAPARLAVERPGRPPWPVLPGAAARPPSRRRGPSHAPAPRPRPARGLPSRPGRLAIAVAVAVPIAVMLASRLFRCPAAAPALLAAPLSSSSRGPASSPRPPPPVHTCRAVRRVGGAAGARRPGDLVALAHRPPRGLYPPLADAANRGPGRRRDRSVGRLRPGEAPRRARSPARALWRGASLLPPSAGRRCSRGEATRCPSAPEDLGVAA